MDPPPGPARVGVTVLGIDASGSEWGALFLGLAALVTSLSTSFKLLTDARTQHRKLDDVLGAVNHMEGDPPLTLVHQIQENNRMLHEILKQLKEK